MVKCRQDVLQYRFLQRYHAVCGDEGQIRSEKRKGGWI